MSINDINNAAAAMNQLKARYEGFLDDADGQISVRQAAYDALSANLKDVVSSEMDRVISVNNTLTERAGTVFPTIKEAVESVPSGAQVVVKLNAGQTHIINSDVYVSNRRVVFTYAGDLAAGRPKIKPIASVVGGVNQMFGFTGSNADIQLSTVDIELPDVTPDINVGWNGQRRSLVVSSRAGDRSISLSSCIVTGGVADSVLGIISAYESGYSALALFVTTFDGPMAGVIDGNGGVFNIRRTSATLLNGAVLNSGGTLGTHFLQN